MSEALPGAGALAAGGDDGGGLGEAVEEGGGELLVAAEDLGPLAKGEVGGNDDGAALMANRVAQAVSEGVPAGSFRYAHALSATSSEPGFLHSPGEGHAAASTSAYASPEYAGVPGATH